MDGKGGTNGFLGGIFQGHRCAKKGHNAVTGHFIDHPFIVMDLVNQDFIDFVHDVVGFLNAKGFHQARVTLHIGKQHRDLLAFSFDAVFLRKNLFPKAFGQVFLNIF